MNLERVVVFECLSRDVLDPKCESILNLYDLCIHA